MPDIPALIELCQAIRAGDEVATSARRKEFIARNWALVSAIDQLAQAEFEAGHYHAAAHKLELLEEMLPETTGIFLRRVSASIRAGAPGALDELLRSASRLSGDNELFHVVEELVGNGRPDMAATLIATCGGRDVFSPRMRAAAQSRVLATTGHLHDAVALLSPEMAAETPNLTAMRCLYLLLEEMLDFDTSQLVCARAALIWGEERDLRHAVERLTYLFDFPAATRLLAEVAERHVARLEGTERLAEQLVVTRSAAQAAVAQHGPVEAADPAEIFAALSGPGTAASRVLWGKQALVSLLRNDRLMEADYSRFAWYLPNWEDGLIRNHVLSAARKRFPQSPLVQRGWLHHLIRRAAYADAARHCRLLLQGDVDEDSLFFVIALLRLQADGVVPSFMEPELFGALRDDLLGRMPSAAAGFRCVMHDHIGALGGTPEGWSDDALPAHTVAEAPGFRRLFAVTTGRLGRVSTSGPVTAGSFVRPVLAISGQLRGFETAWASIHQHLCRPVEAPVVLSVWDKSANAVGRHALRLERVLPEDIVAQLRPEDRYTDTFEQAYPETFRLLFGETDVDAASLRAMLDRSGCDVLAAETESERLIAELLPPHVSANMLKMYYKYARLEALIEQQESCSGNLFSHVIWTRPDCQVLRLSAADLAGCLARTDVVWSSFTTENSFGDYAMVLPRRAFAAIAAIFPSVVAAGDTTLLPWRPNRSDDPERPSPLGAFGGPDVLFDVLLARGYMPLHRIPRMMVRLLGRTPGADLVRGAFEAEQRKRGHIPGASKPE